MRAVLAAIVALVAGCGVEQDSVFDIVFDPCEPIVVTLAGDTPAGAAADLHAAIDMWSRVTPNAMIDDPAASGATLPIYFEIASPIFRGLYDDEHGEIILNWDLPAGEPRAITFAHEIGHALSLHHVSIDERVSVMNHGNIVAEPNPGDAHELEIAWGICAGQRAAGSSTVE